MSIETFSQPFVNITALTVSTSAVATDLNQATPTSTNMGCAILAANDFGYGIEYLVYDTLIIDYAH